MPKPTLCRAHLRMRRRVRRLTILWAALTGYAATGITVAVVIYFGGAPRWAAPVLSLSASLAAVVGVAVHRAAGRRRRWYQTGTDQCGACRVVAEGRRTPDGEPLLLPDTETP